MIELRFRKDLYTAEAINVARVAFQDFATIDHATNDDAVVVQFTAHDGFDEAELAGEFGNYALGATVDGAGKGKAEV